MKLTMVAKGCQNKEDNSEFDGTKGKEPMLLTEEKLYASDIFRMFCYKVLPCTKVYNHNWKTCPFLHEGEKAGRRDPQKYRYVGIECHEIKQGSECSRGTDCPYAHNLFEFWLHPTRYRTQLCNKPATCRRKVCFFAHNVEELRQPASNFSTLDALQPSLSDSSGSITSETESSAPINAYLDSEKTAFSQQAKNVNQAEIEQRLSSCHSAPFPERNVSSPLLGSFSVEQTTATSTRTSPICSSVMPNVSSLKLSREASIHATSGGDYPPHCRASPQIPAYRCESSESVPESDLSVPLNFPLEEYFSNLGGTYGEAASETERSLYYKRHLLSLSDDSSKSLTP